MSRQQSAETGSGSSRGPAAGYFLTTAAAACSARPGMRTEPLQPSPLSAPLVFHGLIDAGACGGDERDDEVSAAVLFLCVVYMCGMRRLHVRHATTLPWVGPSWNKMAAATTVPITTALCSAIVLVRALKRARCGRTGSTQFTKSR